METTKTPLYVALFFCWNSMVILYLNCLNKKKDGEAPQQMYIFPRSMVVSSLFIYFEKTKEAPNTKIKFCVLKGKSISIL